MTSGLDRLKCIFSPAMSSATPLQPHQEHFDQFQTVRNDPSRPRLAFPISFSMSSTMLLQPHQELLGHALPPWDF